MRTRSVIVAALCGFMFASLVAARRHEPVRKQVPIEQCACTYTGIQWNLGSCNSEYTAGAPWTASLSYSCTVNQALTDCQITGTATVTTSGTCNGAAGLVAGPPLAAMSPSIPGPPGNTSTGSIQFPYGGGSWTCTGWQIYVDVYETSNPRLLDKRWGFMCQ